MQKIAIVGAGISGLSAGYFLKKQESENNIKIFEADSFGGQIQTIEKENTLFETGPEYLHLDGLLIDKLIKELNLTDELLKATKAEKQKYTIKEKQWYKFPNEIEEFPKSSLIFIGRKLKIKSFLKKKLSYWDTMSLFDMFKTIFAEQGAEYLGSGFSRAIFGSEADDIEFSSAFPNFYKNLLSEESVYKALEKTVLEKQNYLKEKLNIKEINQKETGLYTFKNGMRTFTSALKENLLNQKVKFEKIRISKITKIKSEYFIYAKGQKFGPFDKVIFSVPPAELGKIFREMDKTLSRSFLQIEKSDLTTVTTVWNRKDFSQSGFGFVTPRKEKINILGATYLSNLFPDKYEKKQFVVKSFFSADTDLFQDEEIEHMVIEAFGRLFKIKNQPIISLVHRVKTGLPKYSIGFSKIKKEINEQLNQHVGIYLLGWHFNGMSINSNVESAFRMVDSEKEN